MSATGRPQQSSIDPQQAASSLEEASLVRIVTGDGAESVAAAGLLARVLDRRGTPFQVAPTSSKRQRQTRLEAGDPDATSVAIGPAPTATITIERTPIETVLTILNQMGVEADPFLAMAGLYAGGRQPDPDEQLYKQAEQRGLAQRAGVPGPTDDLVEALAHSLWLHGPFSGTPEAVRSHLTDLTLDGQLSAAKQRQLRSLVAIDATDSRWPEVTAEAIEDALYPAFIPGPFRTIEGYAELLIATARIRPGTAVTLALGGDVVHAATECWRDHATAVHEQLTAVEPRRYDGILVVDGTDMTTRTIATVVDRLWSPEPAVMAVGDSRVDMVGPVSLIPSMIETIATETATTRDWTGRTGHVKYDTLPDEQQLVNAVRENQ